MQLIAQGGRCAGITSTSNKRYTKEDCFIESAQFLYDQEAPGGPLNFVLSLSKDIPLGSIPLLSPYLPSVLSYAKTHSYGQSDDNLTSISTVNLWIIDLYISSEGQTPQNWNIPASVLSINSAATVSATLSADTPKKSKSTSSELPCPTGYWTLSCGWGNCYPGTNTTQGIDVKGQTIWRNCTGTPFEDPPYSPTPDFDHLESQFNPPVLLSISARDQTGLGIYRVQWTQDASPNGKFS